MYNIINQNVKNKLCKIKFKIKINGIQKITTKKIQNDLDLRRKY